MCRLQGPRVEVRHNTALLERAVELVVQRASIPMKQAEAEAAERFAQAAARRRLATGAAIALAAVGIGLGAYLGLWKHGVEPQRLAALPVVPPPVENDEPKSAPPPGTPERPPAIPTPSEPSVPNPHGAVINYDKFVSQETEYMGRKWEIVAGHHFNTDTDSAWSTAWCYTQQDVDRVRVNIQLAVRESPTALPLAPIASAESLSKVGLNDTSALELASNCLWLDGKRYSKNDYAADPGRTPAPSPNLAPVVPPSVPPSPPAPAPISSGTSLFCSRRV